MKIPINIFYWLQTKTKKLVFLVLIALPVLTLAQTDNENLFDYSPDEINEYFTEEFGLGLRYKNYIPKGNTNTLVFSNDESDYKSYFQVNVMYNKDYSAIISIAYMTGDKGWYSFHRDDLLNSKEENKYEVSEGSETFTFSAYTFQLVKKFDVQTGRTGYMIMILSNTEIENANAN
jgi:hypothetical protein